MKKKVIPLASLLLSSLVYCQVGINTDTPKATFDIVASPSDATKTDGLIPPRLTGDQLRSKNSLYTADQTGSLIYATAADSSPAGKTLNVTTPGYYYFDGTVWQTVKGGGSLTQNATNLQAGTLTYNDGAGNSNDVKIHWKLNANNTGLSTGNGVASGQWAVATGNASATANSALGSSSVAIGGVNNSADGVNSAILGGNQNKTTVSRSFVFGGQNNESSASFAAIVGGAGNKASGGSSIVTGGTSNTASGVLSAVTGGSSNTAAGDSSIVTGGTSNTASGVLSAVTGGTSNTAAGLYSTVSGGHQNNASAYGSNVAGGESNTSSAAFSFSYGKENTANNRGEFSGGTRGTIATTFPMFSPQRRLFNLGNAEDGDPRSDAFTILWNGMTGIGFSNFQSRFTGGEMLQVNGNGQFVTLPSQAGAATDNVVVVDGTGVLKSVPRSSFAADNSTPMNVTAEITGNYTALPTDDIILLNITSPGYTLTFPTTGIPIGKRFYVTNKGTQDISISPSVREASHTVHQATNAALYMYIGGTSAGSWSRISGY